MWGVASKSLLSTCTGHTDLVSAVAAMPDGKRILSAASDQKVRTWLLNGTRKTTVNAKVRNSTSHSHSRGRIPLGTRRLLRPRPCLPRPRRSRRRPRARPRAAGGATAPFTPRTCCPASNPASSSAPLRASASSPAVGNDGVIYFGSNDRRVYAVELNGEKVWSYQTSGRVISRGSVGYCG